MTDILYLPFIQCIDCFCLHVLFYNVCFYNLGFFREFHPCSLCKNIFCAFDSVGSLN